jgi:hypothetical protein
MPGSSQTVALRTRPAALEVSVRSWPLVEGDRTAWLVLTLMVIVLFAVSMLTQSLPTGMVLAALVALAAWPLWLPTRYDLSLTGITRRTLGRARRIGWREIAAVERRSAGVVLRLATAEPALYLPYRQHQADIVALLEEGMSLSPGSGR